MDAAKSALVTQSARLLRVLASCHADHPALASAYRTAADACDAHMVPPEVLAEWLAGRRTIVDWLGGVASILEDEDEVDEDATGALRYAAGVIRGATL